MDVNTKYNNNNIITPRWRSVANYIIIIIIPVQGPNSARTNAAAVTTHTRPSGSFVCALQIDIVRCYYYIHNISVAQRRRPRIFYIYMTYTRVYNILLYYICTHTRTHIYVARIPWLYTRLSEYIPITTQPGGGNARYTVTEIGRTVAGSAV